MSNHTFIQIVFDEVSPDQQEILIALLADAGYSGFEQDEKQLKAFIVEDQFQKDEIEGIASPMSISYVATKVEERNWNEQWERDFKPIVVDERVAIRASFHQAFPDIEFDIVITPKMSFGTGHHATTFLVIKQMLSLDIKNRSVLDFGTGTGVLAILAEKMGAASIMAIDNDDWSIENAKENIEFNDCQKISIQKASVIPEDQKFDIVIANINLNVISENMDLIAKAAKEGGEVIISGFLIEDQPAINSLLEKAAFKMVNSTQQSGWLCIHAR